MEITEIKICTYCKIPRPSNRFRWRYKKGCKYQQGKCIDCENEWQRTKNYGNKEVRRYMYANNINGYRDKIIATNKKSAERRKDKLKEMRATPEWKERHKEYLKKYVDSYKERAKQTKRKYQEKNMGGLTDKYIIDKLRGVGIDNPGPEMIELKRLQIMIIRESKKNK